MAGARDASIGHPVSAVVRPRDTHRHFAAPVVVAGSRVDASKRVRDEAAHPHGPSDGRHRGGGAVFWPAGDPNRQPDFPRMYVDPGDRAVVLDGDESVPPATASQLGFHRHVDRRPAASYQVKPGNLAAIWSAYQTLSPVTTIPIGKPPTWTCLTAHVAGSIRSTSPASAAVAQM